jgi:hypothetical protein
VTAWVFNRAFNHAGDLGHAAEFPERLETGTRHGPASASPAAFNNSGTAVR